MAKKGTPKKTFDIVLVGKGGQGLITLLEILAKAAEIEGYDVKTSELHGLSQRGGSVEAHVKFGKKVHSPLAARGKAEAVIGLEMQECLEACYFSDKDTAFIINKNILPIPGFEPLKPETIVKDLQKYTKKIEVIDANEICQKELQNSAVAGVYLLSWAAFKNLLPLKPESILAAIKESVAPKYLELNMKTFELAKKL
jgi:indolepyruvate ferredoxin oxidoreductase beta subunit